MGKEIVVVALFAIFLIAAILPRIIQKRKKVERVAGLLRNDWPDWNGIGGRFGSEWVADLRRNTQARPLMTVRI